jgi:hypothetical protein
LGNGYAPLVIGPIRSGKPTHHWLAALLFRVLFVLQIIIMSWLLRSDELKHEAERCKPAEPPRPPPPLPADRWSSKNLSVLQGCWYLGREAPAVRGDLGREAPVRGDIGTPNRENCITKVGRICFDASSHGRHEQTISCPRADTIFCSALAVVQFGADGIFRTTQPAVPCQSGAPTKWLSQTLSCPPR